MSFWMVVIGFSTALVAYVVWFYRVEYAEHLPRYHSLMLLLVPDQLWLDWSGGGAGSIEVMDRFTLLAVAGWIWLTAYAWGDWLLSRCSIDRSLDRTERVVFAVALGLAGWSLTTLAIGLIGGLHWTAWFVAIGVTGVLLWGARTMRRQQRTGESTTRRSQEGHSFWRQMRWGLPATFLVLYVGAAAMLPPVDFDVLEYHLQVPKQWFQAGQITFLPENVYGNMPMGGELMALLAMVHMRDPLAWWWGALAGKLIMAGFMPLTALALYSAGRRFWGRTAGLVGASLYLSTPWIAMVSINGLNDGVLTCYLFLSAYAVMIGLDNTKADRPGLLFLAGCMAGSAAGCKYTGLLYVVLPLVLAIPILFGRRSLHTVLLFIVGTGITAGPWLAKNALLTGNPTYPLLYDWFGGATRTTKKDLQWRQAHQVPRDANGRRYTAGQWVTSFRRVLGGSRWHHWLIVPLAALSLLTWRRSPFVGFWWAYLWFVLAAWWLVTHRVDRFWVPALPLAVLLAGAGASWTADRIWNSLVAGLLAAALLTGGLVIVSPLLGDNRVLVSLTVLRDDPEFSRTSIVHRFLNRHVAPDQSVLLVGDAAVFDLQVPLLYNTCFDDSRFEQLFRGRSRAQRMAALARHKVSYVYFDWAEIRRYRETYGFSDYVTPELVHRQLVGGEHLLRPVPLEGLEPGQGELYEVTLNGDNDSTSVRSERDGPMSNGPRATGR